MAQYLKILRDSDIFSKKETKKDIKYIDRQTVKAIVVNKKGGVALVTNAIHHLYLLPGGGAESNNLEIEIIRECLEEINQEIEVSSIVGKTQEFRGRDAKKYITTCFFARAIKKVKKDSRTEKEIENGLKVVWVNKKRLKSIFDTQETRVTSGKVSFYNAAFNIIRDKIFVDKWLKFFE